MSKDQSPCARRTVSFDFKTVSDARSTFSKAVRSGDHDGAIRVIRRALAAPSTPVSDEAWANFSYRSIRAVTARIPAAVKNDLFLEFIRRFPNSQKIAQNAVGLLLREMGPERLLDHYDARDGDVTPRWVEELRLGMRRQLARDFYKTVRAGDHAAASDVVRKALEQDCPADEVRDWASFLFRCLRTLSPHLPDAERHALLCAYADRFSTQEEMAQNAVGLLLREMGPERLLKLIAHSARPQEVSSFLVQLLRQKAGLDPNSPGMEYFQTRTPLLLHDVVRRTALRLAVSKGGGGRPSIQLFIWPKELKRPRSNY